MEKNARCVLHEYFEFIIIIIIIFRCFYYVV